MRLFKCHSRVVVCSNFFTQRVINTVGQFKAKLDKDLDIKALSLTLFY